MGRWRRRSDRNDARKLRADQGLPRPPPPQDGRASRSTTRRCPTDGLPRWVGELYLELHRGTLTSQALVKKLNRESEHRLVEAEALGALAARNGYVYQSDEIETAWKTLLLNQFHDILPGSSIHEVYEDTHPMLQEVIATATALRDEAAAHLGGGTTDSHVLVANTKLNPVPLSVTLSDVPAGTTVHDVNGNALPAQPVAGGLLVHDPDVMVPGIGWLTLGLRSGASEKKPIEAPVESSREGAGIVLENALVRVVIGPDGAIASLFDKRVNRDVLAERGNQLWAYVDKPRIYDAWDIDESYEMDGAELTTVTAKAVTEPGPLRASVRVERVWRDSSIVQTYRLWAGSARLDIETEIEWHEREMLLRARFPLAVHTHEATYETIYGVVRRPTHRNTSWDAARFEVSGHRFADMSEAGYGVALLNDGKYGHSAHGNVLGLSLVRGPLYPDPLADEGHHRFTYSLFPHPGDWTEAGGDS